MNTVILVPRRNDGGPRDAQWAWCKAWWEREHPTVPIFEGHHDQGPFNRSAALNLAARFAGEWDVAIIIDSDVVCDPERIRQAVKLAHETGKLVYPHDIRKDLNPTGSQAIVRGIAKGSWDRYVRRRYPNMVSSVVVIPRKLWDTIGGFDENFHGWGYEDDAFAAAAETFAGTIRLPGEIWHFWHPTAREGKPGTPAWLRNSARGQRYRAATGKPELIRAIQAEIVPVSEEGAGIPRILHRTVPEKTSEQVEKWWAEAQKLHPGWRFMTHRDPLNPAEWPETSAHWPKVQHGAQLADLVRLEALWRWGGVYIDSDVQVLRSFEPLLNVEAFAAWEDKSTVPNAILGARPGHPAIRECLDMCIKRMSRGIWQAGPAVTTKVLTGRDDVLLLPPGSLYPIHYKDAREQLATFKPADHPWAFAVHHWYGSWLPVEKRWTDTLVQQQAAA